MTDNPHRIVIELHPSDGFHTKSHAHLADIVRRRVAELVGLDGMGTGDMVKSVRIETPVEGRLPENTAHPAEEF